MAESDSIHLTHILKLLDKAQARAETRKAKAAQAPHDTTHAAKAPPQPQKPISHPSPKRHLQGNFFVADIFDANPKDDLASMEHPLFALRAGDRTVRTYSRNGYIVTVKPGPDGCATIHDKDILIYCISQLVRALDESRPVSRTVRFTAYDFLKATNRPTSGVGYERMASALARLAGTRIETNIETDGKRERAGFGLIDSWRIIERDADNRMVAIEVTLSDWLYRSVTAKQVKTISRDYFHLRKPLDRRVYELAIKHIGEKPQWHVSLSVLYQKCGSRAAQRKFRAAIKSLAESRELPDVRMTYDAERDMVTFQKLSLSC